MIPETKEEGGSFSEVKNKRKAPLDVGALERRPDTVLPSSFNIRLAVTSKAPIQNLGPLGYMLYQGLTLKGIAKETSHLEMVTHNVASHSAMGSKSPLSKLNTKSVSQTT